MGAYRDYIFRFQAANGFIKADSPEKAVCFVIVLIQKQGGVKKSRKSKYVAYIFTHEERARIFEKSDCVYPNRRSTLHLVMPVLVRLLYSTGMRVMEALTLQMKHVDFQDGTLRLEHAKFDKDRLLPLSPSMAGICNRSRGICI
jgi:integrase